MAGQNRTRVTLNQILMPCRKLIPVGPTAKLNRAPTWNQLERMTPKALPDQDASQHMPLPHVDHPLGGMLLTRKDTVEFFNLVLELKVTAQEKKDLVAFLRV